MNKKYNKLIDRFLIFFVVTISFFMGSIIEVKADTTPWSWETDAVITPSSLINGNKITCSIAEEKGYGLFANLANSLEIKMTLYKYADATTDTYISKKTITHTDSSGVWGYASYLDEMDQILTFDFSTSNDDVGNAYYLCQYEWSGNIRYYDSYQRMSGSTYGGTRQRIAVNNAQLYLNAYYNGGHFPDGQVSKTFYTKYNDAYDKRLNVYTGIQNSTVGTIPKPIKDGYAFNGWYTNSSGGVKILNADNTFATTSYTGYINYIGYSTWGLTENKTLYAQFSDDSITYVVHLNDGFSGTQSAAFYYKYGYSSQYGSDSSRRCYYFTNSNLTTCVTTPTTNIFYVTSAPAARTNYTFDGYYTGQKGTGTKYISNSGVAVTNPVLYEYTNNNNSNVTLYGNWKINNPATPTITGGATKIYNSTDTALTCATTSTYGSGINLKYSFGYATSDGGTPSNWTTPATSNVYVIPKDSYVGQRWYSCRVYAEDDYGFISDTVTSTTTADTEMTINNASITFNVSSNGGTISGTSPLYSKYGVASLYTGVRNTTAGTIPTATKTGYVFNGWWTAASGGTKVINADKSVVASVSGWTNASKQFLRTANSTLYAQFTIANPATPTISGGTTKVYNSTATTLTCATSTTYSTGISKYYSFGYATSDGGTPSNWTTPTTSNTLSVAKDAYVGQRWYSCRVYATDGTLTSGTVASATTADTAMTINNAKITFNVSSNGGTISGTSPLYSKYGVASLYTGIRNTTSGTIPTATKSGYTFNGWWTAATDGTKVINADKTVVASVSGWTNASKQFLRTADSTLYAQFTPNIYSITLNNQSATTTGTTKIWYEYNTTKTINSETCYYYTDNAVTTCLSSYTITIPTKDHYIFDGYYTEPNGQGTKYVSSAGVFTNNIYKKMPSEINNSYTNDITLYANWIGESVTVTYPDNTVETYHYGDSYTFKVVPTKENTNEAMVTFKPENGDEDIIRYVQKQYTPVDWVLNGTHYNVSDTITLTENITLQPQYVETTVPVTFPTNPTKADVSFKGWYTSNNGGTKYTSYNGNADLVLYGQYDSTTYSLSFAVDASSDYPYEIDYNTATYSKNNIHYGDTFTTPAITEYSQEGWCWINCKETNIDAYSDLNWYLSSRNEWKPKVRLHYMDENDTVTEYTDNVLWLDARKTGFIVKYYDSENNQTVRDELDFGTTYTFDYNQDLQEIWTNHTNGNIKSRLIPYGSVLNIPYAAEPGRNGNPIPEGYEFVGWYTAPTGGTLFDIEDTRNQFITLEQSQYIFEHGADENYEITGEINNFTGFEAPDYYAHYEVKQITATKYDNNNTPIIEVYDYGTEYNLGTNNYQYNNTLPDTLVMFVHSDYNVEEGYVSIGSASNGWLVGSTHYDNNKVITLTDDITIRPDTKQVRISPEFPETQDGYGWFDTNGVRLSSYTGTDSIILYEQEDNNTYKIIFGIDTSLADNFRFEITDDTFSKDNLHYGDTFETPAYEDFKDGYCWANCYEYKNNFQQFSNLMQNNEWQPTFNLYYNNGTDNHATNTVSFSFLFHKTGYDITVHDNTWHLNLGQTYEFVYGADIYETPTYDGMYYYNRVNMYYTSKLDGTFLNLSELDNPPESAIPEGYEFVGWYTAPVGGDLINNETSLNYFMSLSESQELLDLIVETNGQLTGYEGFTPINLYAHYEEKQYTTYTVTYPNGDVYEVEEGKTHTLLPNNESKASENVATVTFKYSDNRLPDATSYVQKTYTPNGWLVGTDNHAAGTDIVVNEDIVLVPDYVETIVGATFPEVIDNDYYKSEWRTASYCGGGLEVTSYNGTTDKTYYESYKRVLHFDEDNGTPIYTKTFCEYDNFMCSDALGYADKDGYYFNGWTLYIDDEYYGYYSASEFEASGGPGSELYFDTYYLFNYDGYALVKADYSLQRYYISYYLNGGTVTGTNPRNYTIEDEITLINPTKDGYTFIGWSGTGLTGNNNMTVTIPVGSTGSRTYTANFKKNITVTEPDGTVHNYLEGDSYTLDTNNDTKSDTIDATVTFKYNNGNPDTTSDVVRKYTANGWKVNGTHYDDNSVIALTDSIVIERDYIETVIPAEFPTDPVNNGFTFDGWWTLNNGGLNVTSYNGEEDITLYAHWNLIPPTPGKYTLPTNTLGKDSDIYPVTFKYNNGNPDTISNVVRAYLPNGWLVNNEPYNDGDEIDYVDGMEIVPNYTSSKIPAEFPTNPTKENAIFKGWYDTSAVAGGNKYTSYDEEESLVLYARWQEVAPQCASYETYTTGINNTPKADEVIGTVTFNYHNGQQNTTTNVVKTYLPNGWVTDDLRYADSQTISKCVTSTVEPYYDEIIRNGQFPELPTRDGYEFVGWFTEENGGKQVTVLRDEKNITLHAHWTTSYSIIKGGLAIYYNSSYLKPGTRSKLEKALNYYDIEEDNVETNLFAWDQPIYNIAVEGLPTYTWYDEDDDTTYYYSDADVIYFVKTEASNTTPFYGNYKYIDLSGLNTSKTTNMDWLFSYTYTIEEIEFGNFDTSNVVNMSNMFHGASKIKSLDLSSFDTSKVTNMDAMFYGMSSLESLNLSNFDTSNVTNMQEMFSLAELLRELDLSSFDTSNVTNMGFMFYSISNLERIYVSNKWDVSNVTESYEMFGNDTNLVGQKGTAYNPAKIDKEYAIVDDAPEHPGYLSFRTEIPNITHTITYPDGTIEEIPHGETFVFPKNLSTKPDENLFSVTFECDNYDGYIVRYITNSYLANGWKIGSIHYNDGDSLIVNKDIVLSYDYIETLNGVEVPNDPVKDGYRFEGWVGEDIYEPTKYLEIPLDITYDLVYTAVYTQGYTFTDAEGNQSYIYEGDPFTYPDNTASSYVEEHAYVSVDYDNGTDPTLITIYKRYIPNGWLVNDDYQVDGGDTTIVSGDIWLDYYWDYEVLPIEFPAAPTKEHYMFNGWLDEYDSSISESDIDYEYLEEGQTIYIHPNWIGEDITISTSNDSITCEYGQDCDLSGLNTIYKEQENIATVTLVDWDETTTQYVTADYNQIGWLDEEHGVEYGLYDYIYQLPYDSVYLEPIYEVYGVNGVYFSDSYRPYYDFQGWFTEENGEGTEYTSYSGDEDITLYAYYIGSPIYICIGDDCQNIPYGTEISLGVNDKTKENDAVATVTFEPNNGDAATTSTVERQYTPNGWLIGSTHYADNATITITESFTAVEDYTSVIIGATFPSNPEKANYGFDGWYNNGTRYTSYNDTSDITLTAKWTGNPIQVCVGNDCQNIEYETEFDLGVNNKSKNDTIAATVTYDYHFDDGSDNPYEYVMKQYTPNGWLVNGVHYDNNENITITENTNIQPDYLETIIPVNFPETINRQGYIFKGWYTQATGGEKMTSYAGGVDIIVHAQYDKEKITVIEPDGEHEYEYGDEYTFKAIPTKANENIAEVTFKPENGESDIVRYVQKQYTPVDWILNGTHYNAGDKITLTENINPTPQYTESVVPVNFPEDPEKEHYVFEGWFNNDTKYTSYEGTEDIILTANYSKGKITVTEPDGEHEYEYGDEYTFKAVSTKANENIADVTFKPENGEEDIVRYVQKVFTPYGWELNGTHYEEGDKITLTENINPTPNYIETLTGVEFPADPEKEHYVFEGWFNNDTKYTSYEGTEDIILTAKWTEAGPTSITINTTDLIIVKGETKNVDITTDPINLNEYLTYTGYSDIITVSAEGEVTGIEVGATTITVSTTNKPEIEETINVKVIGDEITSDTLTVDTRDLGRIIIGANENTTIEDFLAYINNDSEYLEVYDHDGNKVSDYETLITTGARVKLVIDNHEYDEVIVIIRGDIDEDGIIDVSDKLLIKRHILLFEQLTDYKLYAADLDYNQEATVEDMIDVSDNLTIAQYILGKIKSLNPELPYDENNEEVGD